MKDRDSVGVEERLRRPVCIVSSEAGNKTSPAVIGACITTKQRWGVINVPVMATGHRSWVMCNQVYCIDKSRLDGYMGVLSDKEMAEVDRGLCVAMGLNGKAEDADEIALLEDEIASLKSEITRLKEQLSSKDAESDVRCDVYKRLYEKALDEFVSYKFSQDLGNSEKERVEVEEKPPVEAEVEDEVEVLPSPESEQELVEINTCTLGDLRQIGVDGYLANNILKHRPYRDVSDLKIVPGMKSIVFALIKTKVCCVPKEKRTVVVEAPRQVEAENTKVNVNTATVVEMMEKAGMVKQLAAAICSYRSKNGKFEKVEDLLKIPRFGTGCMEKYGPMLEV